MSTENPVVIDLGSESIKAGYASNVPSEHEPRIVTPSLVDTFSPGHAANVADASAAAAAAAPQRRPVVERGFVSDWDGLDAMLHYLLYEQLGWVAGEEGSALFVEPLFAGKGEREQLVQLMFEGFNVMGFYVHNAAVLSLFAAGKLAGCSVDVGHGKIDVATVSEGITHAPGAVRLSFAGAELGELLGRLLAQRGAQQQQQLVQRLQPHQLNALKAQCCRVAPSADAFRRLMDGEAYGRPPQQPPPGRSSSGGGAQPDGEQQEQQQGDDQQQQQQQPPGAPQEFTLPDGSSITVTTEGHEVAEALLDPTLLGHRTPGLVDCVLEAINDHPDPSVKRAILENVLVCGGGACAPGLGRRVVADMVAQLPTSLAPGLCALPEYMAMPSPHYVPWVGGAVAAKLVAHQGHFMIKAEYEEIGPSAVHRKCA